MQRHRGTVGSAPHTEFREAEADAHPLVVAQRLARLDLLEQRGAVDLEA